MDADTNTESDIGWCEEKNFKQGETAGATATGGVSAEAGGIQSIFKEQISI